MGSVDIGSLADNILQLTALETAELTKIIEEKLGIPAGSFAMVSGSGDRGSANSAAVEEQSEFSLFLEEDFEPSKKISIIKAVRAEVPSLSLKEGKDFVEQKGSKELVKDKKYKREEAEEIKKRLEEAGAKVTIK